MAGLLLSPLSLTLFAPDPIPSLQKPLLKASSNELVDQAGHCFKWFWT